MENRHQSYKKTLIDKINDISLTYATNDQKILSPTGQKQHWLIDLRPLLLDMESLDLITDAFWDDYENKLPFQIGGMEVAAVPLVTALLMKAHQRGLKTSGFIIRKERKQSGLGKLIEGPLNNDPIILVDDIINSASSLEKARVALEQAGKKPKEIFVILNFENAAGIHWAKQHKLTVNHLLTLAPFNISLPKNNWRSPKINYKVLWRFFEKGAFPFHVVPKSTPLLIEDYLYMGTESGKMFCLDRHTGETIWSYDVKTNNPKGIWSSPAHYNDRIYFGAYNGIAYCLDAKTGEDIWKNSCCEFIGSSPLIVPENNLLYLGLEHQRPRQMGSNAAFDLDTGERIWERAQQKYQHGSAAYYAPKDLIVFGNADHDITAYHAKNGETVWKHETERSLKYPPTIDADLKIVVATSFDGNIYILNVETGAHKAAIKTNDICYTTPLITHGKIFAGSGDRHMYVIDANTYELIKRLDCHARIYSSPRLIDNHVVFGTCGGRVVELNPDTLQVEGQAQLPDAITNAVSASVDNTVLYVSTCMNELYAIERKKLG